MNKRITQETAAHVLYYYGSGGYEPGGFTTFLLKAIGKADTSNRERLARGFPDYVDAMNVVNQRPDGLRILQDIFDLGGGELP